MSASGSSRLPSLERLRKEAKKLLRACRAGDDGALTRVRAGAAPVLADAQRALAREHGFATWADLKREILARAPLSEHAARFLAAVRHGLRERAAKGLVAYPGIPRTGAHAAAAAADTQALEEFLRADPALATAVDEPDRWPPMHYACASPAMDENAVTRTVEMLLAHGADPSSAVLHGEWTLSALYRALEAKHRGAARLLLGSGANPNDGESVYHMAEHDDTESLELLLAHGVDLSGRQEPYRNTPLFFLAGYRDGHAAAAAATRGMRWLLEHGADPNVTSAPTEETALHRVIEFGRDASVIEMLLAHGADPLLARADGRTPYLLALRAGHAAALEMLRERGAVTGDISDLDRFFGACARGDVQGAQDVLAEHPDLIENLPRHERGALAHAAGNGQIEAVRTLAAFRFDPAWEGPWAGTALHHAAWRGNLALVELLLDLGAPVNLRDREYGSSPIGWAAHGSAHFRSADPEYGVIIERLLAAGSQLEFAFNKAGEPPHRLASPGIAQLLRARGFVPEA
jgi:ankyrin repeat protein